ncbi:hypothetical protein [Lutimonas zeaxanthinifaciens]|uniref:hypothetical protein n=1 Tax=Lutimonas zeaxanthinifaciens TaxID=3060215 RepID=UPI00265CF5C9|nr:hypothetical protein [Lutimonas sp. YSD2104]WKK64563.1 hypothetical protein QZH61_08150 [Lutimonas sp. YSD2104]
MKKIFLLVAGAFFLFVSCQSDDLQIDEAAKSAKAKEVTKNITFNSYQGLIEYFENTGGCDLQFVQKGYGQASHIGAYTFVNTACYTSYGLTGFKGVMTAANGDEIHYTTDDPFVECDNNNPYGYCPGEKATFNYKIDGEHSTGRFEGATGWLKFYGIFQPIDPDSNLPEGEFEIFKNGWGEITY